MGNVNLSEPCLCHELHPDCDPSTCPQAAHVTGQHAPLTSFRELRKSADRGCQTCATVVEALLVPEVRAAWRDCIAPALEAKRPGLVQGLEQDEDLIELEFDPPDTEGEVRIVKTGGERARYVTLSHRWGAHESFTLTKSNEQTLADGISWETIPKTFQDAIWLTRQLNIEYIWIDTICIVQDDPEDWRRESVRMKFVYGKSYINIAVSHATDSSADLFTSSDLPQRYPAYAVPDNHGVFVRQQPYQTHNEFGSNYGSDSRFPLLRRGWVLQERLLSPRVVYFDAEERKWECNTAADCQCGGIVSVWNFKIDHCRSVLRGETPLSIEWMRIAERYSELELTYDSDRVVALAGIAAQASRIGRGGRYLAGVWEEDLAHQLCWEILDTHRKPDQYVAPSWSWLSVFGSVGYFNRMDYHKCSQIDVEITEVECATAEEADETGPVVGGFLKLNGRCAHMRAELLDPGSRDVPPKFELTHKATGEKMGDGEWVEMDFVMSEDDARKISEVVVLYWGDMCDDRNNFLVLKAVTGQARTFERLGIFWYDKRTESEELGRVLGWCRLETGIVIV
ncbi:HET domain-containing protein [Colletotrichum higginsianum]|uniref:HET domain-containing protein n=1 Tax=Colletotrichum higginsianum (strain IMI 349063) TaxID=759273 RepID=H1V6A6_COLHI|nr:HET domain-containing protein [Colletotrichum higginsianum]